MLTLTPARLRRYACGWLLPALVLVLLLAGAAAADEGQSLAVAREQLHRGEFAAAMVTLQQTAEAYPYSAVARQALAEGYFRFGLQQLEQKQFVEAAEQFRLGQAVAGEEQRFWRFRGLALLLAGQFEAAEAELNEALAMAGPPAQTLLLLGQLHYRQGRLAEASQVLQQALELDPELGQAAEFLAQIKREAQVEERMATRFGGNFSVTADGRINGGLGDEVLAVLEDAYNEVGNRFDRYPPVQVPVLLYGNRDFSELTGAPDWAGGLYDGKIRVPVGGLTRMTPSLRAVLYHEYSHVLVKLVGNGRCPLWLNEGLAQVAEAPFRRPPLETLPIAARDGRLLPLAALARSFQEFSAEQVALAYQESYSFTRFLVGRCGWPRVVDILAGLAEPASAGLPALLLQGCGDDLTALEKNWQAELSAED